MFSLPPLRDRREDVAALLQALLTTSERSLGRRTGFNADALARYLRFALDPAALWAGNLRDLDASVHRLAVLAERGCITVPMVGAEIALLTAQWRAAGADRDHALLREVLPEPESIEEFDRAQLAAVIRACRDCASLSAAGRRLFAASRQEKASQNDADRLRKYLARFGLDRVAIRG
ncbi:transcriptional regulator [Paracoccus sp. IB05]|uniref:transcriptional regulator n=1 Tax=Paracoccus sp. IB05 TaxID=2779367 RepID=UPI0018E77C42|nr:transcriptional regulator [Paracoccus sp. IB05]MBJ2150570.1 transcriptional regulator [Paracoccus sp. IB05]